MVSTVPPAGEHASELTEVALTTCFALAWTTTAVLLEFRA